MRILQALQSFVLALGVMASVATPILAQQQVAARPQRSDLQDRIKDMVTIGGIRPNQLVGYGLVVGLNGTGDGSVPVTNQTLQSLVARFGINVDAAGINPKNAAAVMVTAELPAFAKPGQRLDVTVSAFGKATSLRGGSLLMTQLVGADNETYAMAQGNWSRYYRCGWFESLRQYSDGWSHPWRRDDRAHGAELVRYSTGFDAELDAAGFHQCQSGGSGHQPADGEWHRTSHR